MDSFKFYFWKEVFLENNNSELIWEIVDIVFDKDLYKVLWFITKKSFRYYNFFYIEDIKNISDNLIIKDINDLSDIENNYEILWKNVLSKSLVKIWTVEDLEFSTKSYKLESLIVDMWYIHSTIEIKDIYNISLRKDYRKYDLSKIISFNDTNIIVEDREFLSNSKKTFENISKIFINNRKPSYLYNITNYAKKK